jgi:N-methylhydantoinase A
VLASEDGTVFTSKVPSTPDAPERAVIEGVVAILKAAGAKGEDVLEVLHGTTIGSNALLEKTGAATGLITTKGFRDILEIGRVRTPDLFDLTWTKPVPADRTLGASRGARTNDGGRLGLEPLSEDDVLAAGTNASCEMGVTSIAVCYINSYRNPDHERRTREILARGLSAVLRDPFDRHPARGQGV